jgi:hypothetical protein
MSAKESVLRRLDPNTPTKGGMSPHVAKKRRVVADEIIDLIDSPAPSVVNADDNAQAPSVANEADDVIDLIDSPAPSVVNADDNAQAPSVADADDNARQAIINANDNAQANDGAIDLLADDNAQVLVDNADANTQAIDLTRLLVDSPNGGYHTLEVETNALGKQNIFVPV